MTRAGIRSRQRRYSNIIFVKPYIDNRLPSISQSSAEMQGHASSWMDSAAVVATPFNLLNTVTEVPLL